MLRGFECGCCRELVEWNLLIAYWGLPQFPDHSLIVFVEHSFNKTERYLVLCMITCGKYCGSKILCILLMRVIENVVFSCVN